MGNHDKIIKQPNPAKRHRRYSPMVKEALDNLPSGICYLDKRGVPLLINRKMYELMYHFTNRDIQDISDFDDVLSTPFSFDTADDSIWQFRQKFVGDKEQFIEIIASDVTELYHKKTELEQSTLEQQMLMNRLEEISKNVVSITRNEEILEMKMHIHNDLGIALAETRQNIRNPDYDSEKKANYIRSHRRIAEKLLGEVENDDEINIFLELKTNAEKLGSEILLDGEIPKAMEGIMTQAVRECLINAIRHGNGDKVYVKAETDSQGFHATITNNGKIPDREIKEAGGLLSLRGKIEAAGGSMTLSLRPELAVVITLPLKILEDR